MVTTCKFKDKLLSMFKTVSDSGQTVSVALILSFSVMFELHDLVQI